MSEQRSHARAPFSAIGRIDLGEKVVPCMLLDLSEGGMALVTSAGAVVDGPVQVSFDLGAHGAQTNIDAQVICQEDDPGRSSSRWSLRNLSMDPGTRTRLRGYLRREQNAGI
jgi:c-di-GMP-binding flagellar brake protein YcgR